MNKRHKLYRYLIDWLYPNICPSCGCVIGYNDDFCKSCYDEIIRYNGKYEIEYADSFNAFCVYDDRIKRIVNTFKHDPCGNTYYAFAKGIETAISANSSIPFVDAIVYVPMMKEDEAERGYNQSELIAKELSHLNGKPCVNGLIKIKDTRPQKSLNECERKINVKDAFAINEKAGLKGKSVLLIDDLCTTGSTLSECAKALKNGGVSKVFAASFAKTDRNYDSESVTED